MSVSRNQIIGWIKFYPSHIRDIDCQPGMRSISTLEFFFAWRRFGFEIPAHVFGSQPQAPETCYSQMSKVLANTFFSRRIVSIGVFIVENPDLNSNSVKIFWHKLLAPSYNVTSVGKQEWANAITSSFHWVNLEGSINWSNSILNAVSCWNKPLASR